jgi:hypothetical protein
MAGKGACSMNFQELLVSEILLILYSILIGYVAHAIINHWCDRDIMDRFDCKKIDFVSFATENFDKAWFKKRKIKGITDLMGIERKGLKWKPEDEIKHKTCGKCLAFHMTPSNFENAYGSCYIKDFRQKIPDKEQDPVYSDSLACEKFTISLFGLFKYERIV